MNCARASCSCVVAPDRRVELDGTTYCCETCARECTDERCVCTPCGCEKASRAPA